MPSSTISNSSLKLLQNHFPLTKGSISKYANMKRRIMIAAGDRPSSSRSFELMKVVPQMADVSIARI